MTLPPYSNWPYLAHSVCFSKQRAMAYVDDFEAAHGEGAASSWSEETINHSKVTVKLWLVVCRRDPRHARGDEINECLQQIEALRRARNRPGTLDAARREIEKKIKVWQNALDGNAKS